MTDPTIPQGSVVIPPIEMYKEIQDIGKKVDHLTSVVDPAIADIRNDIAEIKTDKVRMEVRISKVETKQAWMSGIFAAVSTLLTSGLVTALIELYGHGRK